MVRTGSVASNFFNDLVYSSRSLYQQMKGTGRKTMHRSRVKGGQLLCQRKRVVELHSRVQLEMSLDYRDFPYPKETPAGEIIPQSYTIIYVLFFNLYLVQLGTSFLHVKECNVLSLAAVKSYIGAKIKHKTEFKKKIT